MVKAIGLANIVLTINDANIAEPISSSAIYVTDFKLYVPITNAGSYVYVGSSDVDTTWIPLPKGSSENFTSGTGTYIGVNPQTSFDLSKIFVKALSNNDVVICRYFKAINTGYGS